MSENETALAVIEAPVSIEYPHPVMDLETAQRRLAEFQKFVSGYLVKDEDYGTIPGTPKPTLYKPGADKLCELYGFADSYDILSKTEDFDKGLFDYSVQCRLTSRRDGMLVATGLGSCNSYEGRYRFRDARQKCPSCQQETIFKSKKTGEGWFCWQKKGGCGAQFPLGTESIASQVVGKVVNDDIATLKNTILKMAKKRAKVDATLGATRSSGIFTQDVEDIGGGNETAPNKNDRTVTGILEEVKAFEHCSVAKVNGEKLVVLDTGFDSELVGKEGKEVTVQVTEAVGPKGKYWEVTGIVKKAQGTQLERQLGASIKQAEAQKPKPKEAKPITGDDISGTVEEVKAGHKKNGTPWMCTKLCGWTVWWAKPEHFEHLKTAKGKFCRFKAKPGSKPYESNGTSILRIGELEWMEDGVPVIQRQGNPHGQPGVFDEPQNVQALDEPAGGPEAA